VRLYTAHPKPPASLPESKSSVRGVEPLLSETVTVPSLWDITTYRMSPTDPLLGKATLGVVEDPDPVVAELLRLMPILF